jgi:hypothetical protein
MVRIGVGSCSPEKLTKLQYIFDAVWRELVTQRHPALFPWDVEASRYLIAQQVLLHADDFHGDDVSDAERIKDEVLRSFEDQSKDHKDGPRYF